MKLILCLFLSLPLMAGAQEKKGKAVAKVEEEKIAYSPGFRTGCPPPVITKEKITLKAWHSLGYHGRGTTYNEVVLALVNEGGITKAKIVSNVNYEVDKKGALIGKEWPVTDAYVWAVCLRRGSSLPDWMRELFAGWESDFLLRVRE